MKAVQEIALRKFTLCIPSLSPKSYIEHFSCVDQVGVSFVSQWLMVYATKPLGLYNFDIT